MLTDRDFEAHSRTCPLCDPTHALHTICAADQSFKQKPDHTVAVPFADGGEQQVAEQPDLLDRQRHIGGTVGPGLTGTQPSRPLPMAPLIKKLEHLLAGIKHLTVSTGAKVSDESGPGADDTVKDHGGIIGELDVRHTNLPWGSVDLWEHH
ncbi:hypothetical protein B7435_07070 [Mycolicibacterium peregrinum]|uniref:hypothetical protein n=1 Tax=Mycolicibacterium peregrinum TaxID=43304 RepID=UPI000B4BF423|nr:hypothetical protein [Mycolicibacterium peregrinum]OWM07839.1 hypothetical protein B7435_07070 [Mycolicibacterium peregrinum]